MFESKNPEARKHTIKQQKPDIKQLKTRIENEFEDEIYCEEEN